MTWETWRGGDGGHRTPSQREVDGAITPHLGEALAPPTPFAGQGAATWAL